ncbi:hypothetical protein M406DRAFT_340460 [Cryphonectria parasitica EP155]|uniref:Sodium/calcium exchanger membrane region domain-containing protein n=1 Tax=Cryphonectria parasitica (strain ATCC 38755 / EP155) TaxID=660469 RepID=A0A9P4Y1Y3_CRYP1|nr:uncharacterized protein M406DRAFT_340460 [Cryphonectria parasitica EP155]KAF3764950.1 hypothetical protein M406DRAFT_340460 [Cryphonectria parasitica EP155]
MARISNGRPRAADVVCDDVHHAEDQCSFVREYCAGDEPGLLSYLGFYYCVLPRVKPFAFTLLALWLGLLFSTIGIAASDFFSVNLSTIASVLGMPESLAGVTFLALGNGSPDVFSTFAAMGSNSGGMAIGELIGAAGFITAVVAGSMALVREFKVSRKTFVRDIVFFIVAVSFTMLFLVDGKIHLWECGLMIGFYVFYVCFVVLWHWFEARRRKRRNKQATSRSHFSEASTHVGDDIEPYRDNVDEEDEDGAVGRSGRSEYIPDISALESGPMIHIDGSLPDDDDEDKKWQVASEMTSSMRVNRPRGRRTHSTVAPIRPSLVGALEFRSVISSLARSRNMRMAPLQRGFSEHNIGTVLARSSTDLDQRTISITSTTKDGHLAPPDTHPRSILSTELVAEPTESPTPALSLQIPSPLIQSSQGSSPSLSPFPGLQESPIGGGQLSPRQSQVLLPSPRAQEYEYIPGLDPPDAPKPISWWPYKALPPPHVLWRTLLPTLQGWKEKNIWDKVFSIFSLPSVFLLVVTLPVVETDAPDDDESESGDGYPPNRAGSPLGIHAAAIASESQAGLISETEWQEYRRRAHSRSSSVEEEPSSWKRWLVVVQIFTGPLFTAFIVWAKYMDQPVKVLVRMILCCLVGSLVLLAILLLTTSVDKKPKYHFLFCFLGFIISVAWISTIAEEVVGVLKAVGVILGMSEAILGLTVFAVGNSVGDLVADITVARLGYPVMALSACFGGPMLNILLGIGLGGTYMTMKKANRKHEQNPDVPIHYGHYHIDITGTLFISAITVLITLLTLLIIVPSNNWMMTRKIGLTLIALWVAGTIANVIVEVTGAWEAVA